MPVHSFEPRITPLSRRGFLATTAAGIAGAVLGSPFGAGRASAQSSQACAYLAEQTWADSVKVMLAAREHRLKHVLWHALRNSWANFSDAKKKAIADLGWEPPRPSMIKAKWDTAQSTKSRWSIGPAGEDFLFFHRDMIKMTDDALVAAGKNPLESWSRLDAIPAPGQGCPDEGVPQNFVPAFADGALPHFLAIRVRELKSDGFFWSRMAWWDNEFKDESYLRSISLGELGARMELSVHNQMHIRWSAFPSSGTFLRPESDIDPSWDVPGYDTLFDEYSSHVNPVFFRLHKWIDNRIEDWAAAHADRVERFKTPAGFDWFRDKDGGTRWVQVPKPWMGGANTSIQTMERVHGAMFALPAGVPEALALPAVAEDVLLLRDLF